MAFSGLWPKGSEKARTKGAPSAWEWFLPTMKRPSLPAAEAMRSEIAFPVLIGEEKDIRARAESLGFSDLAAKAEFVAAGKVMPRNLP